MTGQLTASSNITLNDSRLGFRDSPSNDYITYNSSINGVQIVGSSNVTQINNGIIGDMGFGLGWSGFAHSSNNNTQNYALLQDYSGYTFLNYGSGCGIGFRQQNVDRMVLDNLGLRLGGYVNSSNNTRYIYHGYIDIGSSSTMQKTWNVSLSASPPPNNKYNVFVDYDTGSIPSTEMFVGKVYGRLSAGFLLITQNINGLEGWVSNPRAYFTVLGYA